MLWGVAVLVDYYLVGVEHQIDWVNVWLWVLPVLIGVIIGEHYLIWGLAMGLIRAIGLLMEQESNPCKFIWPIIKDIDFFPDPLKGVDLDYICLKLNWVNTTRSEIRIENISGEFTIDGTNPADEFKTMRSVMVKPYEPLLNTEDIIIHLGSGSLPHIKNMRVRKSARGSVKIRLSVYLNGKKAEYDKSESYRYVD